MRVISTGVPAGHSGRNDKEQVADSAPPPLAEEEDGVGGEPVLDLGTAAVGQRGMARTKR
jgi:hypothetical protein